MARTFSTITDRLAARGANAWAIHAEATVAQRDGRDVIILSIGEPNFDTPEVVIDSAVAAMRTGDTHYTETAGRPHLRRAVAARQARLSGRPVDAQAAVMTAGAQTALFMAALITLGPGDHAVVLEPAYVTYPATVGAGGAAMSFVPAPAANNFRPDLQALAAAIRPETRAIVCANPNNPSGTVFTRAELQAIADLAERHDLWIIVDEVYADLCFDRPFISMAAVANPERVITVGSLSKSHAMTGWRTGWLIGAPDVVAHAERLALTMVYGLPGFIQEAAAVALTEAAAESELMRLAYWRRRDLAVGMLKRARGLTVHSPEAGMFMMIDVGATGLDAAGFSRALYDATGVAVLDGAAFGAATANFLRVSFSVDDETLVEGCRRIAAFSAALCDSIAARAESAA